MQAKVLESRNTWEKRGLAEDVKDKCEIILLLNKPSNSIQDICLATIPRDVITQILRYLFDLEFKNDPCSFKFFTSEKNVKLRKREEPSMSLFSPTQETPHSVLKELFLELLNQTERKCKRICKNTYDQERYFMISFHPDINQKKTSIDKAKEQVLLESGAMRDDQDELFYKYTFGLCKLKFNFLFMQIFTGKINKHWLPVAEKYNLSAEPNPDPTCRSTLMQIS